MIKNKRASSNERNPSAQLLIKLTLMYAMTHSTAFAFSKEINDKLDQHMQHLVSENKFPGINIGIWVKDKLQWKGSFGLADKATQEPMTLDHYVRIGSITKTFVGVATLQLVDEGKIKLDDPVSKYVNKVPQGDIITLRLLGNMRSGLPNYSENKTFDSIILASPAKRWTRDELLKVAFSEPNMFAPDTDYHYSNTNTVLLGLVIEKVTGKKLAEYLSQNIFAPLKLTHTSYPTDKNLPKPYAHGYTLQTPGHGEADSSLWDPNWADAAGQLVSTFDDLSIWTKALGTGQLLSKESFKEMTNWRVVPNTKNKLKYGITLGNFDGMLFHTGELPGYNTLVAYSPLEHFAIVISTNTDTAIKDTESAKQPVLKIFDEVEKILSPRYIKNRRK